VALSTSADGASFAFLFGSVPQVFGIYVQGPKGPVAPDPAKVLPENWMHQQHSAAAAIKVAKGQPWRLTLELADYFPVGDAQKFVPGKYQVTVKFLDIGLGLKTPIESGPVQFEIKGPPKTAAAAVATFQALARVAVARVKPQERRQFLETRVAATKYLKATRQSYKAARARIDETLTPAEKPNQIVHGALVDMSREGDCWTIESSGSSGREIVGYLDMATGRLVLVWIVPEG
jgi:hypothetical protein